MPDCEWCKDEICVNADCPMCCDYCPVSDIDGVCRFEKRESEINVESVVTIKQWISVKDRLPEAGQEVLIVERFEDEPRHIMSFSFYDPEVYYLAWNNVTHWMPIPEPPKTE